MGKVRIKALGDETAEKKQKKQAKIRAEEKKTATEAQKLSVSENIGDSVVPREASKEDKKTATTQAQERKETQKTPKKRTRSKKYYSVAQMVEKNKTYDLSSALSLLPKLTISRFDETVELHINTVETGISASITLPHGTGKKLRVAIADEGLISQIEKGVIDFDILLAQPQMMPKLARVARVLGPKGLMPNPKNGTITDKPQEAIKKYEGGLTTFKTEAKAPIIHLSVGKLSFGEKKLFENITSVINAVRKEQIKQVVLKSTMSPAIKIDTATLS